MVCKVCQVLLVHLVTRVPLEMMVIMVNLEKQVQEVLLELMVMLDNLECWVPLDLEV